MIEQPGVVGEGIHSAVEVEVVLTVLVSALQLEIVDESTGRRWRQDGCLGIFGLSSQRG